MDDFIALRCPSCGGNIQVEENLEKIFCTHCGTQLLLKQGADGLLTPMMARDLTASARLKETQTSLMVVELLKTQIKELEEQGKKVRREFLLYCKEHQMNTWGSESKTLKLVNRYTHQVTGKAQLTNAVIQQGLSKVGKPENWTYHIEVLENMNLPGLNTPAELLQLYQFITQPKNYDQEAYHLALVLHPITQIWPVLQKKRQELQKAMDNVISTGIQ